MSTTAPAPWTLGEAGSVIPIKDANGRTVASVRYGPNDLDHARLIAAAPDLLEAARRSLNWLSSYPGGNAESVYDQMRAAIAKTEGK